MKTYLTSRESVLPARSLGPSRVKCMNFIAWALGFLAPVACLSRACFLALSLVVKCRLASGLCPCEGWAPWQLLLPGALPVDQQPFLAHRVASPLHLPCRSGSVVALWKHTPARMWATCSPSKLPTRAARPWPTVSELRKYGWTSLKNSTTTAIPGPAW